MMLSLLCLFAAASAMIAFTTSALVGVGLAALRQRLAGLTPTAEARVLLGAALLPMLTCAATMAAALAPSFGWIVDHCVRGLDSHAHPHICVDHHVSALPAPMLVLLAGLIVVRLAMGGARLMHGAVTTALTGRALARVATTAGPSGLRVLPLDEPQAFVVGVLRPMLFVTRGLVSDAHREHLTAVVAHEHSHLRRRDPLRRAVATLALAFHLPGLAGWLDRRLARAHELAADADAAHELGSRTLVARALVRLTRAHLQAPRMALAFAESDVEARVAALLDNRPRHDQPHRLVLLAGLGTLFIVVGSSADTVHHNVEIVLGLLGG